MLRTLLSPRLVGLHVLLVVALISAWLLGRWQLGVFEESGRPVSSGDPQAVAVSELTRQGQQMRAEAVGRLVSAEGVYDAPRQLLVANREPDTDTPGGVVAKGAGYWVLTPLILDDGTTMPIVRGWVKSAADPATAVPEGRVAVTGRIKPSQGIESVQRRGEVLPAGQVMTVSASELINVWQGVKVREGFVVATESIAPGLKAVAVRPPQTEPVLTWRNLAYAAQWWIFGLFAAFMWFHFVRDSLRSQRAAGGEDPGEGPGEGPGPGKAPGENGSSPDSGGALPLDRSAAPAPIS
ncbi:Cytochrome oxidase assembly protein ShyY1 [Sinosporangium album]|uniref:SURF1-like protein n=1 Tax=Sinosporangium album TaxID=504805 RepID=A0A1G7VU57_9ACTN|nr:SURF1 family protein [Sinosporangium album]SDG62939.1 Cytochrome oxidase assembly protein ShyY1 [Sinosporangium album]